MQWSFNFLDMYFVDELFNAVNLLIQSNTLQYSPVEVLLTLVDFPPSWTSSFSSVITEIQNLDLTVTPNMTSLRRIRENVSYI